MPKNRDSRRPSSEHIVLSCRDWGSKSVSDALCTCLRDFIRLYVFILQAPLQTTAHSYTFSISHLVHQFNFECAHTSLVTHHCIDFIDHGISNYRMSSGTICTFKFGSRNSSAPPIELTMNVSAQTGVANVQVNLSPRPATVEAMPCFKKAQLGDYCDVITSAGLQYSLQHIGSGATRDVFAASDPNDLHR